MTKFLKKLFTDVFKNNNKLMREWIIDFLGEEMTKLDCSHAKHLPDDYEMCAYYDKRATNDKSKGGVVRKSTVWNSALEFSKSELPGYDSNNSTKIDIPQLVILLKYDDDIGKLIEEWVDNKWIVCHACGCGKLAKKSCAMASHIYLATNEINNDDTSYHKLLKNKDTKKGDYLQLVILLNKLDKKTF
jgi:hypothetical protein